MTPDTCEGPARGVRDRLLDALESLIADEGTAALSHRSIARRADVNTSLLHYHFGTIEEALEIALARRASRFVGAQLAALRALRRRLRWTVEDVVAGLWRPFADVGRCSDGSWHNYLCLVAHLGHADDLLAARHFQDVEHEALYALRNALPDAPDETLASGLRLTRVLFHGEVLARCRDRTRAAPDNGRDESLTAFAAAGIRALLGVHALPAMAT
jgi:AcrR family transcriptional regulator